MSYLKNSFSGDLKAGFITAVVALPLAIAFAIASGVPPVMGMYTAIIAGVIGSATGGSRFSITGPTGAMTVIILAIVNQHGLPGLLVAGLLAGVMQILFGVMQLGMIVKFIPLPVISGFTAGIGLIIFIGQIPAFLGVSIPAQEHIWQTIGEVWKNRDQVKAATVVIALATISVMFWLPKLRATEWLTRRVPPAMMMLIATTAATYWMALSIPLVGQIPSGLPQFSMLDLNLDLLKQLLPSAFTIALLGSIEAMLCAVVCDSMTATKHNSNRELIGQGLCNVTLPFFGGIPSTAAIARSAVNIREGAKTRMSGIYHAIFLLITLLFLGPIAAFIPKAFLAGVLMLVSARMINLEEFKTIISISRLEAVVLFATFFLTAGVDLVFAVQVGMALAVFLLFVRLVSLVDVTPDSKTAGGTDRVDDPELAKKLAIFTIQGPFFFGAVSVFEGKVNEHMTVSKPVIILRMKYVPFIDSSGVERLRHFVRDREKHKSIVLLSGMKPSVRRVIRHDEELCRLIDENRTFHSTHEAIKAARKMLEAEPLNAAR